MLKHIHLNNIIHWDLKPENIIVGNDGYLTLIDLGICKIMDNDENKTFTLIGTPHYMAPEIILG